MNNLEKLLAREPDHAMLLDNWQMNYMNLEHKVDELITQINHFRNQQFNIGNQIQALANRMEAEGKDPVMYVNLPLKSEEGQAI